jgi:hypothetical protein
MGEGRKSHQATLPLRLTSVPQPPPQTPTCICAMTSPRIASRLATACRTSLRVDSQSARAREAVPSALEAASAVAEAGEVSARRARSCGGPGGGDWGEHTA